MKNVITIILVVAICTTSAIAATDYYHSETGARVFYAPSISTDGGVAFTIPLSEDFKTKLQVPRTSWNAKLNLCLLSVQVGAVEVHTGPYVNYVSDSMHVGKYYVEKRLEIGFGAMAVMHLSNIFNLGIGYGIGVTSTLFQMDVKWASHSIEIRPEFNIKTTVSDQFQVLIPIRATYAYNYLGLNAGIGFRWLHSKIMKAPVWLLQQQLKQKQKQ